jgi:hypothetical protein
MFLESKIGEPLRDVFPFHFLVLFVICTVVEAVIGRHNQAVVTARPERRNYSSEEVLPGDFRPANLRKDSCSPGEKQKTMRTGIAMIK